MKERRNSRLLLPAAIVVLALSVAAVINGPAEREPHRPRRCRVLDSAPVKIDWIDPSIDRIIPKGAMLRRVADGLSG
jgi:hypothetical protein